MIETDQLLYERRGATAHVIFNRPEARNAMTWEMYDALFACCEESDADESVIGFRSGSSWSRPGSPRPTV
jgi:enoyl-CoA hydratase/carnithine racemase